MTTANDEPVTIEIDPGVKQEAKGAATGFSAEFLESLADRIGAHAGSTAVFDDPIEKDGRTVIPVAQSMWGTGAGSGQSEDMGSGGGGGGGAMSRPVGFI